MPYRAFYPASFLTGLHFRKMTLDGYERPLFVILFAGEFNRGTSILHIDYTALFQQFCTLQCPLLAHQFGKVRMQGPNLVYPWHQAVQVLLAPRTPKDFESDFRRRSLFYYLSPESFLSITPSVAGTVIAELAYAGLLVA